MNDNLKVRVRFRDEAGNIIQARSYESSPLEPLVATALIATASIGIILLLKASLVLLAI